MIDMTVVDLSRLQSAAKAPYHFPFVPRTPGRAFLPAVIVPLCCASGVGLACAIIRAMRLELREDSRRSARPGQDGAPLSPAGETRA